MNISSCLRSQTSLRLQKLIHRMRLFYITFPKWLQILKGVTLIFTACLLFALHVVFILCYRSHGPCMEMFNFPLPSVCISNGKSNFLRKLSISDNIILSTVCWISGLVLKCVVLLCLTYLAMVYFASFSFVLYVFYCCCLWWRIKLCVYSWYHAY